jgi:hypothetical protein
MHELRGCRYELIAVCLSGDRVGLALLIEFRDESIKSRMEKAQCRCQSGQIEARSVILATMPTANGSENRQRRQGHRYRGALGNLPACGEDEIDE